MVRRGARLLGLNMSEDGAREVAARSRGTPRIAGRLLRRVRDFALMAERDTVDAVAADAALTRLQVDNLGLDTMDRRYMHCIGVTYTGGPVGIETLAAALSEPRDAIEDIIEPYLMQIGLVQRTPRGRMLSPDGWKHLGLTPPPSAGGSGQLDMLGDTK
nr:Holliday junction DNA helicase RuvB C-terminal domain-containing protein [Kordiimonas gwangyangensis]